MLQILDRYPARAIYTLCHLAVKNARCCKRARGENAEIICIIRELHFFFIYSLAAIQLERNHDKLKRKADRGVSVIRK
jgi:hypothetical protein